jgi:hypothetical protein
MHCIQDVQEYGTTHIKFCTKVEQMGAYIYEMVKTAFKKEAVRCDCGMLMMGTHSRICGRK